MAIQTRRGAYENFDPLKLLSGEWAAVLSGDPNATDGRAAYLCFEPGNVKRMATYEDMVDNIQLAAGDVAVAAAELATAAAEGNITAAVTAANNLVTRIQGMLDAGQLKGSKGDKGDPGSVANLDQQPIAFSKATVAADITTGDTLAVLFGKLSKCQDALVDATTEDIAVAAGISFD